MDVGSVVHALDAELAASGTRDRAEHEKQYLKSDLGFYGVTVPTMRRIAKRFTGEHPDLARPELIDLVEALWKERVHERRALAVLLLERFESLLEPDDIALVEILLRESRTWALVDNLAACVAGPLLERHPDADAVLDRWAVDDDFWIRRSALLAHLLALRSGAGDFERFARYADAMLDERQFFIRKAIGWTLRDTARSRPQLVYEWIAPRTQRASGVTVREVIKRLPTEQAEEILTAYREKRPAT